MTFLFVFFSAIYTYKLLRFILQKTSPFNPNHLALPSPSESTEHDVASASSSRSSECNTAPDHSSSETSENDATTHASTSESRKYDVFLSFRGEDTRKTFVDHLYYALQDRQINTYKDDIDLPRGQSIGPSLKKDIKESRIAVIVFSKNYANSSWCLDELAYIMKCKDKKDGLIVMPLFYDVDPSNVRKQNGDFGKAFTEQEARNTTKAKSWRKALVDASNITGWEIKSIANGHEALGIKNIVNEIFNKLFSFDSNVDDQEFVGMSERLQLLESLLDMESHGVRMVGIWGMGGSGKTTLATYLYMKMSHQFQGHCIVGNVREESKHGLKKLQENILSVLCKEKVRVQSLEEGKHKIESMLCRRNVLVLLDDVDNLCQLEALAGNHKWFGSGSRILITTRDEHLLRTHEVDHVLPSMLLTNDESIQLFNRHAFKKNPVTDYETLSVRVVSYAAGLPLALKVLGSFLYGKSKNEWTSALKKLEEVSDPNIINILKISYDGLESYQKELFLDIACFWRREYDLGFTAKEIFEACGYYPDIGLKVLREKALITIDVGGRCDMHDLVQEMAHYIVRGEHPNNPEEHSRVWKKEDIKNMSPTMENNKVTAIKYSYYVDLGYEIDSSHLCTIVSNLKKLRWISFHTKGVIGEDEVCYDGSIFHSNELRYINWQGYPGSRPFLDTFKPVSLVVLKLSYGNQEELWEGCKKLRWISFSTRGVYGEDEVCYDGSIFHSNELRYINWEWYPGSRPFLDTFKPVSLLVLKLSNNNHEELWEGCKHLPHLKKIDLRYMRKLVKIPEFDGAVLKKLTLYHCDKLEEIHPSFGNCTGLEHVEIFTCPKLKMFPTFAHMRNLKTLWIKGCDLSDGEIPYGIGELFNLQELVLRDNKFSRLDFSLSQLTKLKHLDLSVCYNLIEIPELPLGIATFNVDFCFSLTLNKYWYKSCEWLCQVSFRYGKIINDSGRLLHSMLEGKAIENGVVLLKLRDVEIPKAFTPHLVNGSRYRLELSEKWCNDFSGFLICLVFTRALLLDIEFKVSTSVNEGMDSENEVVWEESEDDPYEHTVVGYVSFDSLRHTSWWDQAYKALQFDFDGHEKPSGCGVRLVDKKSRTGLTKSSTTTLIDSSGSPYTPKLTIKDDSASELKILLHPCRQQVINQQYSFADIVSTSSPFPVFTRKR